MYIFYIILVYFNVLTLGLGLHFMISPGFAFIPLFLCPMFLVFFPVPLCTFSDLENVISSHCILDMAGMTNELEPLTMATPLPKKFTKYLIPFGNLLLLSLLHHKK